MALDLLNSLSQEYNDIQESGEFSDTEILVGKEPDTKVFKAHSLILRTRSPYFRTALSSNWIKTENGIIKLQKPNISIEIFEILLKYIYSSMVDLAMYGTRTNIALLIAADELCISNLCEYIENHLITHDEDSLKYNFVLIQKTASHLTQFTRISQFYKSNVQQDPSLILRANDFTTIQEESLLNFLIEYSHSLMQIEVWDKLVEWSIVQSHELPSDITKWTSSEVTKFGSIIQPFIPHVNFKKMSLTDFCHKIKPLKNIFDFDFYIQILEYYSFNEELKTKFKLNIDSKIINSEHAFLIGDFIKITRQTNRNEFYDFQLLVRGSRDGFSSKIFHKFCDEKGPTITIARVKNTNEIVGGFNPLDWSPKCDDNTQESFIFSLDKNVLTNYTYSKVVKEKCAINKGHGPDFGDKKRSDLRLLENGKRGKCYKNNYEKLIRKNEGTFEIDDYEVFKVINVTNVTQESEEFGYTGEKTFVDPPYREVEVDVWYSPENSDWW